MNIVFHSYEEPTGLPPDVSRLVEILQTPLPPWLDIDKLTSWCKERRVHELDDFCDAHMNDEVYGSLMEPLRDVLSLAMRIDVVSRIDDEFSPRRTQYLWLSLIQRLGLSSHLPETTSILCDQVFTQPDGFNSESGTASMLVSFKADRASLKAALNPKELSDPFEPPHLHGEGGLEVEPKSEETEVDESECEEDAMDISEDVGTASQTSITTDHSTTDHSTTDHSTTDDPTTDDPNTEESFSGVDSNRPSTPPFVDCLDVPLCAHILTGSYGWPIAIFPIFSVADSENIIPLVASIACQRAVWDIQLPVVAFEISSVDRIGCVHIGWAEETVPPHVPVIHILRTSRASSTCHLGSPGVFDLGCPESAAQFSNFVLSLDDQLNILEHNLPLRHPKLIRWRPDEVMSMRETPWPESNDRVKEWSKDVANDANTSQLSSTDSSDILTPVDDHIPDIRTRPTYSPAEDVVMPEDKSQPSMEHATKTPKVQAPSSATRTSGLNSAGRFSNSKLANRAIGNIDSKLPSTTSVLFGRRAFCIAKEKVDVTGAPAELKDMIDYYDEMGVKNTPLKDALSEFMAAYDKLIDQGFKPSTLEDVYGRILVAKFREMGGVSWQARLMLASHIVGFIESETRTPWDQILSLCYVTAGDVLEAHSDHVLFEAELRMASNPLANLAVDSDEIEEWSELALVYVNMCAAAPKKARGRGAVELESLYHDCIDAANDLHGRIHRASRIANRRKFLEDIRTQADMEPSTGTCDALLVAPIRAKVDEKDIDAAGKAYHGFCLVHSSKHHARFGKKGAPASPDPPSHSGVDGDKVETDEGIQRRQGRKISGEDKVGEENRGLRDQDGEEEQKQGQGQGEAEEGEDDADADPNPVADPNPNPNPDPNFDPNANAPPAFPYPLGVPSTDEDSVATNEAGRAASPPSSRPEVAIYIPQLVVEYKKPSYKEAAALNQGRIYLTTSVLFLAHLGILDHPVFGLVVNGMVGSLIMAWKSSSKDAIFIIERNVKQFDLTNILHVYQFMTFLQRLRTREEEIMAKIQGGQSKLKNPETFIKSLYENGPSKGDHTKWAIPAVRAKRGKAKAKAQHLPTVLEIANAGQGP